MTYTKINAYIDGFMGIVYMILGLSLIADLINVSDLVAGFICILVSVMCFRIIVRYLEYSYGDSS